MERGKKTAQYIIPSMEMGPQDFQNVVFKNENSQVLFNGLANWAKYQYKLDKIRPARQDFPLNTVDREHLAEGLLLGWQQED